MARIVRPQFGSRHHRPSPNWILKEPPNKRRRVDWQLVSLVVIVFVAGFVWLFPALDQQTGIVTGPAQQASRPAQAGIEVVDGDTVRSGGATYRLIGFDTPEQGTRAHCWQERALASKATNRLRELVVGGGVALSRVSCACRPGTEGTDACNYGRLCGTLQVRGRDVGQILIAEGLAERYSCGGSTCPRRKDWCAG
jgi:Staphylococcal nuclease homologue